MSLPACQQRALDRIEGALRASEPHLTSMYAIFARLNADEPIGTEQLAPKRLRWFQPGTAMYAIVLIPVMFAAIIVGALLGGGARSTTACEASYSVGGVSPLASRPSCPVSGKPKTGVRKTISTTVRLACTATAAPSRFITMTGDDQAFSRLRRPRRRRLARPKYPECARYEPGTEDLVPIEQLGHEAAELLSLTNGGEARSLNKLAELAAWQVRLVLGGARRRLARRRGGQRRGNPS